MTLSTAVVPSIDRSGCGGLSEDTSASVRSIAQPIARQILQATLLNDSTDWSCLHSCHNNYKLDKGQQKTKHVKSFLVIHKDFEKELPASI